MKLKSSCIILLSINSLSVSAEVTLDGTLGRGGTLPGPNYLIGADLGRQKGGNLFHSFQGFNLNPSESATFSGPNSVSNIISRVTGGNPSNIDGLIRSTIPNADMYFLNPYGMMFGPNAELDVQGSFHASTADYLRLGDGGRFDARNPSDSLLTVAPVASFGFLSNTPARIRLQDSHLFVSEGISLIGGDIDINASELELPTERELFFNSISQPQNYPPQLFSFKQINLISVAEHGEVAPDTFNIRGGQITINKSHVGVINNGEIFIRAGELKLVESLIGSISFEESGLIDISVDNLQLQGDEFIAGIYSNMLGIDKGSAINLRTNDFTINKGGVFNTTFGTGEGGDTFITASDNLTIVGQYTPELNMPSGVLGLITEENAGNVGDINIQAGQMTLTKGAQILNRTLSAGDSGAINISVDGAITITGEDEEVNGLVSGIFGQSGNEEVANSGDAAQIRIEAQQIKLADGARIASDTFGFGNGGDISIQLTDSLTISGQDSNGYPSNISASSIHNGHAGNIDITTKQITLTAGGSISSASLGAGNAGSIDIQADQIQALGGVDKPLEDSFFNENLRFFPSSIFTSSAGQMADIGDAGPIKINARQITLLDGAGISSATFGFGNAGDISIQLTDSLTISGQYSNGDASTISASSFHNGHAGNIDITAKQMTLTAGGSISSDTFGFGNAGDISIQLTDSLTISGQGANGEPSFISAGSLHHGHAGNVDITAKQITLTAGGTIHSVTFGSGNAGSIDIQADQIQILGGFDKPWESSFLAADEIHFLPSGIFTTSAGKIADIGDAGPIKIEARQITLLDGGQINSGTYGGGEGSTIKVTATDSIIADGEYIGEELLWFSGITSHSDSQESYAGNAGNLVVQADSILLSNEGAISSEAGNASGGNININTSHLLYLRENGRIVTSVNGGDGNGGNLNLGNSQFIVLDDAHIKAQAYAGRGGNIKIDSEQFIRTPDSLVSASSKLGIDGEVKVGSPSENVTEGLLALPTTPIDNVSTFSKNPCEVHSLEEYTNRSRFDIHPIAGSPTSPFDLQPSRFSFQSSKIAPANSQKQSQKITNPHLRQMALVSVCQPSLNQPETQAVQENSMIHEPPLF